MPQKFKEWTIKDHYPDKNLQDIQPISLRAYSLVSRNSKGLETKEGALNLLGALDMMEALDYHFKNFIEFGKMANTINQKHEAVAYINRVGQLYYFTKSSFTKKYNLEPKLMMPKLDELIIFRMKNTAHRSLDAPKTEDLDEYQNRQAFTFLGATSMKFLNDDQYVFPNYNKVAKETEWRYFTPAADHPIIMKESYELVEKIIKELLNTSAN